MFTKIDAKVQKSVLVEEIIEEGRKQGFYFRFLARSPMLGEPVFMWMDDKEWKVELLEEAHLPIPPEVEAGARFIELRWKAVGRLVAHELEDEQRQKPAKKTIEEKVDKDTTRQILTAMVSSAAIALANIAALVFWVVISLLFAVDPILIVVVAESDGSFVWIEAGRWV